MSVRRASSAKSSLSTNPSSSTTYSFQHLLESPPSSPLLPSMLLRHGENPSYFRKRSALKPLLRVAAWICGMGLIFWFGLTVVLPGSSRRTSSYISSHGESYELATGEPLPDGPTPWLVTDKRGRRKWTVLIQPTLDFPLKPDQYTRICSESDEISKHVQESGHHDDQQHHAGHFGYYHVDQNFMDVFEAEQRGLLPGAQGRQSSWMWKSSADEKDEFCEKSMTYVLETTDAGLGNTLMGLWLSYGLAQKEGRAFFIDDSNWAYGKYETYFQPPPQPSCTPPPYTQRLPCPHHARHLLVSSSTTSWTFGHKFNEKFEDAHKVGVLRQEPIFTMIREGYEALFRLAGDDAKYFDKQIGELDMKIREEGGLMIGVHVRHGDRHPWEFKYQKSYLPLEKYIDKARDVIDGFFVAADGSKGEEEMENKMSSKMVLATDDPEVYASTELSHALHAQEQILLTSKSAIDAAQGSTGSGSHFVEENVAWDGGFFANVFWGLGDPRGSKTAQSIRLRDGDVDQGRREAPSEVALQLRELVGRAYLLDLAVVGQADSVVCGASTAGCRLLAVMMGWERGIVEQGWHSIDGDFDWKGLIW